MRNQYLLVGYYHDTNYILAEPMKNRKRTTISTAQNVLHNKFKQVGATLQTYVLDNEVSKILTDSFETERIHY